MTRTPKNASSASSPTTSAGERSRSSRSAETTYPTAPPPSRSAEASPWTGSGAAVGDVDDAEQAEGQDADQPMPSWRPAGPLPTGSRISAVARRAGPAERHEPADLADRPGDRGAGEVHDAARRPRTRPQVAMTRATPHRLSRPKPSRRCSGSRSLAPWPMPRATAPIVCAKASQSATTPRPSAVNPRSTGPGPLRTARGAGRRAELDFLAGGRFLGFLVVATTGSRAGRLLRARA